MVREMMGAAIERRAIERQVLSIRLAGHLILQK